MRVKQVKINEALRQLNEDISRKLAAVNDDINEVFAPQRKFLEETEEELKIVADRGTEASVVIGEVLRSQAEASCNILSHAENIKTKVSSSSDPFFSIEIVAKSNFIYSDPCSSRLGNARKNSRASAGRVCAASSRTSPSSETTSRRLLRQRAR